MPLYAYRCTQCGHRFEKIQSFSAEPETVCPKCGGVLERPLTAPALQFKGAGWYVNDYSSKGASSNADKPAEATASGESKGTDSSSGNESKSSGDSKPVTESKPAASDSAPKPSSSSSTAGNS